MAKSVLVDASFLVAIINRRDAFHPWATAQAPNFPPPWRCCDAVLSEAFFLLGSHGSPALVTLLRDGAVLQSFHLGNDVEEVVSLMLKYADVPMSFADACLVRMTEALTDPILLTADSDFRIYRRRGRQVIPCVLPH